MPTFIRARLPAAREQEPHDRTRDQKLRVGRDAGTVATTAAVEKQLAARPHPGHDVLEVRQRRRRAAEHRGIQETAPCGEQPESDETACDLEALVLDVLVRYLVAGDMQNRPEQQRGNT